jgi:hypothetical protein
MSSVCAWTEVKNSPIRLLRQHLVTNIKSEKWGSRSLAFFANATQFIALDVHGDIMGRRTAVKDT